MDTGSQDSQNGHYGRAQGLTVTVHVHNVTVLRHYAPKILLFGGITHLRYCCSEACRAPSDSLEACRAPSDSLEACLGAVFHGLRHAWERYSMV